MQLDEITHLQWQREELPPFALSLEEYWSALTRTGGYWSEPRSSQPKVLTALDLHRDYHEVDQGLDPFGGRLRGRIEALWVIRQAVTVQRSGESILVWKLYRPMIVPTERCCSGKRVCHPPYVLRSGQPSTNWPRSVVRCPFPLSRSMASCGVQQDQEKRAKSSCMSTRMDVSGRCATECTFI